MDYKEYEYQKWRWEKALFSTLLEMNLISSDEEFSAILESINGSLKKNEDVKE